VDWRLVGTVVRLLWREAAPGLKPLRLPRARSPERARAETGRADSWVLKRRELPGLARVIEVTSASLGYPLSVFNKKLSSQGNTHNKSHALPLTPINDLCSLTGVCISQKCFTYFSVQIFKILFQGF